MLLTPFTLKIGDDLIEFLSKSKFQFDGEFPSPYGVLFILIFLTFLVLSSKIDLPSPAKNVPAFKILRPPSSTVPVVVLSTVTEIAS